MKNWEKKIVDETSELFDLFLRLHAHEKAIERIRERIVCIENSIYQQRPKDYIETVLNFMKTNKDNYFPGYYEFFDDLVANIENYLSNFEKYNYYSKINALPYHDRDMMRGMDLVDYFNDL
jgi:hypothetical protein